MIVEKKVRPKTLEGETIKAETGCGHLYITINEDNGELFEVFAKLGKAGGCSSCQLEALTRSITLGLRCGVPVEEYIDEIEEIACPNPMWHEKKKILSCPDAIAKALKRYLKEKKKKKEETIDEGDKV